MNDMIRRYVQWACCVGLFLTPMVFACPTQDDFSGVSINAGLWGSTQTGGASAPSQAGGKLTTRVTTNTQNQRALLYSVRTDLNFFAQPLTLSASIASLGGTGTVTHPVNRYLLIGSFGTGTETLSRYYPGTELTYGVWLSAGQTNGVNYLEVGTVRIGVVTTTREVYSGVLTSMSLVLDKTSYSVSASGTGGFSVGSGNSFTGTLANVVSNEFNNLFRFAMGAANSYQGSVTASASAEWNSVSVMPGPYRILTGDDFSGASIDTVFWGSAHTGEAIAPSQADGKLTTRLTGTGQNQRALLYSARTDLNFFARPITVSANIAALGGTGAVTFPVNRYLLIGSFGTETEILSRYYPGTELRFGAWLSAGQTNGVNYLEVGTVRIGNVTVNRHIYSGVLTTMSLTLDKTSYAVTASGTGGFSVGSGNSFTGTLANVHSNDYNNLFRFAMGAANSYQGSVTAGASAEWNSVSLTYAVDLSLSLVTSTNYATADDIFTIRIDVNNLSSIASGVYYVTNTLTANMAAIEASDGGVISGSDVVWMRGNLGAGCSTFLTVTVRPVFTGSSNELNNTMNATVTPVYTDPNPGNNTASSGNVVTVGIPVMSSMAMLLLAGVVAFAFWRLHRRPVDA